jgi:TolB protein
VSGHGEDAEIYTMNVMIGTRIPLTNRVGSDADPVWSSDGEQVVFTSDQEGDREIYRMRSDGSMVTLVTVSLGEDFEPDVGW